MDDRLIKLGMSSDFSGFRETEKKDDKRKKREKDMRRHTDPGGICAGAGMAEEGFR